MAPTRRFDSMFVSKVVLVVLVVLGLFGLFCAGHADASEAAAALPLDPQCNSLSYVSPDCETWCWYHGHPGGYVKSDVCCCNSGQLDDDD